MANFFNKVALQGLKKNHTRTFVTIIGVMLSAALITAVQHIWEISLLTYLKNGSHSKNGDWQIEFTDKDYAFIEEQADNHNVEKRHHLKISDMHCLTADKNRIKPYLFIKGFQRNF